MVARSGGVGEIRACLIGGFRVKIDTFDSARLLPETTSGVPRVSPLVMPDGSVASLDMVRLALRFGGSDDDVARFEDGLMRLDSLRETFTMGRSRPGRFAHLYTFEFGGGTVALGVGQFAQGVTADMGRGFLEFNPNKVGADSGFLGFISFVSRHVVKSRLVRYDLAVDLPTPRDRVRTRKDRRSYEFVQGSSLTEYLGARNHDGRVKVYDKASELGLDGVAMTRVELTCSGDWSVADVLAHWPTVFRLGEAEGLSGGDVNVVVALMALEIQQNGGSVVPFLRSLNKHRAAKVRRLMEGACYDLPESGAVHVLLKACEWSALIVGVE